MTYIGFILKKHNYSCILHFYFTHSAIGSLPLQERRDSCFRENRENEKPQRSIVITPTELVERRSANKFRGD